MQWTKSLLNFFYPNRCPACEALIGAHELLCNACGDALLLEQDGYCHYCGKTICRCSKFPHAYDRAVVCSAYEGGAVPAVIALKRSSNTNFAVYAAQILARRLEQGALYYHKIDCVMPVPMHRSKQRQRGYNQAALIGKEIARLMDVPYREDVLCKGRSKVEQHQLSAEERARNVDSFSIRECDLDGMHILLCDDVLTTGNTMHRCAGLLKERGASFVVAAAAATSVPKNQKKQKDNPNEEDTT